MRNQNAVNAIRPLCRDKAFSLGGPSPPDNALDSPVALMVDYNGRASIFLLVFRIPAIELRVQETSRALTRGRWTPVLVRDRTNTRG